MSLKSGCFQDLSIGGLQVMILTHREYVEMRDRCYYSPMGIARTEVWTDPDEPENKWIELWRTQHAKFLDRRFD